MKLRRFEFGIAKTHDGRVEVCARRGDGARYLKSFVQSDGLLAQAEADFAQAASTWTLVKGPADSPGMSEVWTGEGTLYISGEAAITRPALENLQIDTIISMSKLKPETRAEINAYLTHTREVAHVDAPMLDVLARHQTTQSQRHAAKAIHATVDALRSRQRVLVHCLMGIHRSVAIASVALAIAHHFPTARDAFLHIQARRHLAGWNPETIAWLERLKKEAEA